MASRGSLLGIRVGEGELFRLQKRLKETESSLEVRESQLRSLSIKVNVLEESERSLKLQLESFTKQAKDTYRKYDAFLESADEIWAFSAKIGKTLAELMDRTLESLSTFRRPDFKVLFDQALPAIERESVNSQLRRMLASQNLRKKGIFQDPSRIDLNRIFSPSEFQVRFDKVFEDYMSGKKEFSDAGTRANSSILTFSDKTPEKSQKSIAEISREDLFEINLKSFLKSSAKLIEMFKGEPISSMDSKSADSIALIVRQLSETFQNNLCRSARSISDPLKDPSIDINGELEKSLALLKQIEQVEYGKLQELRTRNGKLQVIRSHIESLTQQNEELFQASKQNQCSLLEQKELISALESNIHKKRTLLSEKQQNLKKVEQKSSDLQSEAARLTSEIIGTDQKIAAKEATAKDLALNLELSARNLEKKRQEIRSFETQASQSNVRIQKVFEEAELLDLEDLNLPFEHFETREDRQDEVLEAARKRARAEVDRILLSGSSILPLF